eukprot:2232548-Amphidinium_carterae.1
MAARYDQQPCRNPIKQEHLPRTPLLHQKSPSKIHPKEFPLDRQLQSCIVNRNQHSTSNCQQLSYYSFTSTRGGKPVFPRWLDAECRSNPSSISCERSATTICFKEFSGVEA